MATKTDVIHYVSPIGQLSYANLFEFRKKTERDDPGKKDSSDATLIMNRPKDMTPQDKERFRALMLLAEHTREESGKVTDRKTGLPNKFVSPFRYGYEPDESPIWGWAGTKFHSKPQNIGKNPEYENKITLKGVCYGRLPQVFRQDGTEITVDDNKRRKEIYSGCFVRFHVTAFAYDNGPGVSFSLQGVKLIRTGEPLGFKANSGAAFQTIGEDEDQYDEDAAEDDLSDI